MLRHHCIIGAMALSPLLAPLPQCRQPRRKATGCHRHRATAITVITRSTRIAWSVRSPRATATSSTRRSHPKNSAYAQSASNWTLTNLLPSLFPFLLLTESRPARQAAANWWAARSDAASSRRSDAIASTPRSPNWNVWCLPPTRSRDPPSWRRPKSCSWPSSIWRAYNQKVSIVYRREKIEKDFIQKWRGRKVLRLLSEIYQNYSETKNVKKESEKYKVNDIKGKKETNKVRESAINKSERRK